MPRCLQGECPSNIRPDVVVQGGGLNERSDHVNESHGFGDSKEKGSFVLQLFGQFLDNFIALNDDLVGCIR